MRSVIVKRLQFKENVNFGAWKLFHYFSKHSSTESTIESSGAFTVFFSTVMQIQSSQEEP